MLLRSQLVELARTFTQGNVGHLEKLYLQDIMLHSIYHNIVGQLVLKGGTALFKLYNLDRFSEDLGFTAAGEIDLSALLKLVERDLSNFGANVDRIRRSEDTRSFSARFGIQGPLYTGADISLSYVRMEVNRGTEEYEPLLTRYSPHFPDIPAFDLVTLTEREILAEKIRAACTRRRPRDIYDIYHLINMGIDIDEDLADRKLAYYGLSYDPTDLLKRTQEARKSWPDLESLTYTPLPEFDRVVTMIRSGIDNAKPPQHL